MRLHAKKHTCLLLLQVRVIRDGAEAAVSCFDLLVGDVVVVETGDILPADGWLLPGQGGELRSVG